MPFRFGFFQYFLDGFQNNDAQLILIGVMVLLAAIISIVAHEVAHGYAAKINGDRTAQMMGRLTLNPVKHFDLQGFLFMFLLGFGWAKPVPVNPDNFRYYKKGMFMVSVAGVTVNLILAFFSYPIAILIIRYASNIWMVGLAYFFWGMFNINLILIVFNLIPVYPLDGFRVIEALGRKRFWVKYKNTMYQYGNIIMLCLMIVILFFSYFLGISILGFLADLLSRPIELFWGLFL